MTPASAETICAAFTRNANGSWTSHGLLAVRTRMGVVPVEPSVPIHAGMSGPRGQLAAELTLHCPGVPHVRVTGQPNPYLDSASMAASRRWGNKAITPNGIVIEYSPPSPGGRPPPSPAPSLSGGSWTSPSKDTVLLNVTPPSVDGNVTAPSKRTVLLNDPPTSGEGNGAATTNGIVILNSPSPSGENAAR